MDNSGPSDLCIDSQISQNSFTNTKVQQRNFSDGSTKRTLKNNQKLFSEDKRNRLRSEVEVPCISPNSGRSFAEQFRYGWRCITPTCLQPLLNNAKAFLIFVTIANVLQGALVNGLVKVDVTSIERRFKLYSSESGIIISSYDIAGCLCLLPISYIGGRGHKPRWISVGVLLLGIGSLVLALPNFIAGPYEYRPSYGNVERMGNAGLCIKTNETNTTGDVVISGNCDGENSNYLSFRNMKYVFMMGQFLIGIGSTPLSVLAVTMIDESVIQQLNPIHIGIFYLGALVGPALGFILGGNLLTTFTNLNEIPTDITPDSPNWVGAWWVGFLITGVLSFCLCIPLFGYPKKLPITTSSGCHCWIHKRYRQDSPDLAQMKRESLQMEARGLQKHEYQLSPSHLTTMEEEPAIQSMNIHNVPSKSTVVFREFSRDIFQVVSNKAFMFLSLSAAIFSTLVSGFSTFGPKFIESQLGKSAADAANLFGYVCIPAGASGMLIGALLMVGLKMNHKSSLQMCIAVSVVSLLAHFVLILDCEDADIAGVTVPYPKTASSTDEQFSNFTVSDSCNLNCHCPKNFNFNPICGTDNIAYYSPCHAGCSAYDSSTNQYRDCSCMGSDPQRELVKTGICSKNCRWETLILFSLFLIILSTFLCTIPGVDLSLRCFPNHQRSLAIGVQWILIRTLGSIPGPILFGHVIDSACLLMDDTGCSDKKGSCVIYKNSKLSSSFLLLSVIYKVAGVIFLSLALLCIESCTVKTTSTSRSSNNDPLSSNNAGQETPSNTQLASAM